MGAAREIISAGAQNGSGSGAYSGSSGKERLARGEDRGYYEGSDPTPGRKAGLALAREGAISTPLDPATPNPVQSVQDQLEWAGSVLLSMRIRRPGPAGFRNYWPDFAPDAALAYGYTGEQFRPATPAARDITEMDRILAWIELIPLNEPTIRRVVSARALVSPINDRYLFSWRKIAKLLHIDSAGVRRLHKRGLAMIVAHHRKNGLE